MADVAKRYSKRIEHTTPAIVQQASGTSNTTSVSATWPSATTEGNTLFAILVTTANSHGTGPFGTEVIGTSAVHATPTPDYRSTIYALSNAASQSGAKTWTGLTAGTGAKLYLVEVSGLTSTVTDSASDSNSGTTATLSALTSHTAGAKGFALLVAHFAGFPTTPTSTHTNGSWVALTDPGGNPPAAGAYYRAFTNSTGTETAPAMSSGFSANWVMSGAMWLPTSNMSSTVTVVPAVSASKKVILRDINITNRDASSATVDVDIDATSDSSLFTDLVVPVGQTIQWTGFLPLDTGESLTAYSTQAVDITVGAVEVDA